MRPRVAPGRRYRLGAGEVEVDSIQRPAKAATPVSGKRQRARILAILKHLPEAQAIVQRSHLSLEVRKKRFGYYLEDHHGDGRIALHCKSSEDLRDLLQEQIPAQLHVPK